VCLVGCRPLVVDEARRAATIGPHTVSEGDWLSLDGERGEVALGQRAIVVEKPRAELAEIERWRKAIDEDAETKDISARAVRRINAIPDNARKHIRRRNKL
jgi:hypothetical protein